MSQNPKNKIIIIDHDPKKLNQIDAPSAIKIQSEVIDYIIRQQSLLRAESVIIPAVPFHLAFEWLTAMAQKDHQIHRLDVPPGIISKLPHPGQSAKKETICSYADFICPEDCIEPEHICTMTGKPRGIPLFELMTGIKSEGFRTGVIRSRQIGPGIGGYPVREIWDLKERIGQIKGGKWLIGTACRCHGILSALKTIK